MNGALAPVELRNGAMVSGITLGLTMVSLSKLWESESEDLLSRRKLLLEIAFNRGDTEGEPKEIMDQFTAAGLLNHDYPPRMSADVVNIVLSAVDPEDLGLRHPLKLSSDTGRELPAEEKLFRYHPPGTTPP